MQIVYVGRRRDAGEVAEELDAEGLGAVTYHAGLTAGQRHHAQEAWLSGRRPIVVATVACGIAHEDSLVDQGEQGHVAPREARTQCARIPPGRVPALRVRAGSQLRGILAAGGHPASSARSPDPS